MAMVWIPTQLTRFSGGKRQLEVHGRTVREILDGLETICPGIRERLLEDGELDPSLAVAVDGEVTPLGLLERVGPSSEVHFLPALSGGAR